MLMCQQILRSSFRLSPALAHTCIMASVATIDIFRVNRLLAMVLTAAFGVALESAGGSGDVAGLVREDSVDPRPLREATVELPTDPL